MATISGLYRLAALLGVLGLSLAGCGSDSAPGEQVSGTCTVPAENSALLATAKDWYLYQDLLPASVDPNGYATPQKFLDAITAKARCEGCPLDQQKDREWSFLITKQAAQQYFTAGQSAGFGLGLVIDASNHLLVQQVFGGSPAFNAGFKRGDDILAIGTTAQTLVPMTTLLGPPSTLSDALSSGTPGTLRYFQVQPVGTTAPADIVVRSPTSVAAYDLDPVVSTVIATPSGNVGYVHLRTFVSTAEARLRTAFAAFKAASVQNVIVDVRYNGGGLLSTANVLGSLLHPVSSDLMYRFAFNAKHPDQNTDQKFSAEASGLATVNRVAFITTGDSASASELVPNALAAYLGPNIAIVGDRTYGKPVGQASFDLGTCADALYLISFQLQNKDGYGDYYGGLPAAGFAGTSCQAADDLAHPQGDPAEDSTQKALAFVTTGSCGTAPIAAAPTVTPGALRAAARPSASLLRPFDPTPAQRDIPGLY
jgi:carboxyl-terminal processing protease